MSNYCHMEKVFVHPGSLIQYHPKRTERYHDSATVIREHPGGLYRPWYSLDFFICKMGGERLDFLRVHKSFTVQHSISDTFAVGHWAGNQAVALFDLAVRKSLWMGMIL